MNKVLVLAAVLLISGCAALQSPRDTNVAVSALLDELQIAINEIDKKTSGSKSLPPFKGAQVTLTTRATESTGGSASLVLSGERSKATTDSNIITLELVPDKSAVAVTDKGTGREIADYVIAAVTAVDAKQFLKLKALTVEAGLEVKEKAGGGVDVELVGVTLKGNRSGESTQGNTLKLVFQHSDEKR